MEKLMFLRGTRESFDKLLNDNKAQEMTFYVINEEQKSESTEKIKEEE